MSAETTTPAPEQPAEAPDPETGPSAPLTVDDALTALRKAVSHHPSDSMSRSLADLADALIRERAEQTAPPAIAAAWSGAVQFLADLQGLLDRLDADQARNASAVLSHLFARQQPAPNGGYRG